MEHLEKERRERRRTVSAAVRIMWRSGSGDDQYAIVKALDLSDSGLRVEMPYPVIPRSYVTLSCGSLGLQGNASVRYCTRQGFAYRVGLEFTSGMFRRQLPI